MVGSPGQLTTMDPQDLIQQIIGMFAPLAGGGQSSGKESLTDSWDPLAAPTKGSYSSVGESPMVMDDMPQRLSGRESAGGRMIRIPDALPSGEILPGQADPEPETPSPQSADGEPPEGGGTEEEGYPVEETPEERIAGLALMLANNVTGEDLQGIEPIEHLGRPAGGYKSYKDLPARLRGMATQEAIRMSPEDAQALGLGQ